VEADLSGAKLDYADLRGVDFERANLSWANLYYAKVFLAHLDNANLYGAYLNRADFQRTTLQFANLSEANLTLTKFREARLACARLQNAESIYADFRDACLNDAILRDAILISADFRGALLNNADLSCACLEEAKFGGANLNGAILYEADLTCANLNGACVTGVKYDRKGKYCGIRVEECYGSAQFKRHAQDQDWLEEFLDTRETWWQKAWAWFWGVSCDCGRSFYRWGLVSFLIALFFAYTFTRWPDWIWRGPTGWSLNFAYDWMPTWYWNTLANICPQFNQPLDFFSALYFSIVTFTTLGFGDIHATNLSAKFLVTVEVIIGYIMLGGLISILANKLARRS
jgi:uncharacterized protein YjbI with pentapeptide repeats